MMSERDRIWLAIADAFTIVTYRVSALLWMNCRLQAMAEFNRGHGAATLFNPDKTQVMLEFALLGDMLTLTENEAKCQEQ